MNSKMLDLSILTNVRSLITTVISTNDRLKLYCFYQETFRRYASLKPKKIVAEQTYLCAIFVFLKGTYLKVTARLPEIKKVNIAKNCLLLKIHL